MGGTRLAAVGMQLQISIDQQSVMGFTEVLTQYPRLRRQLGLMQQSLRTNRPDLLLLVDYPGFNMRLARTAREMNIPVLYFIAPKVWASRPGRVSALQRDVTCMAAILPFEVDVFESAGINTRYVGNPVLDNSKLIIAAAEKHKPVDSGKQLQFALLPGSRMGEIKRLLPVMLMAARQLATRYNSAKFVLPVAETVDRTLLESALRREAISVELLKSDDYQTLAASQAAVVASGTATLELAVLNIPMVAIYRMTALSFWLARRMLLIENVSLVNIVAQKRAVEELIQEQCTASAIADEIIRLIDDQTYRSEQLVALQDVNQILGTTGAAEATAQIIEEYMPIRN